MTSAVAGILGVRRAHQQQQQRLRSSASPPSHSQHLHSQHLHSLEGEMVEAVLTPLPLFARDERERDEKKALYELLVSIPTHLHKVAAEDVGECAICLCAYEDGDRIKRLPCEGRHGFHSRCLRQWLQAQRSCPVCRFELTGQCGGGGGGGGGGGDGGAGDGDLDGLGGAGGTGARPP